MKLFTFIKDLFLNNSSGTPLPKLQKSTLLTIGEHHDIQSIYERLNASYFNDELKLSITWFGNPHRKVKSQRILGLFDFTNQLIKVHKLLDHPHVPPYFVSYIIYHEMLHSVLPPVKKKQGRHAIHHAKFKQREKCFADYERARDFEKQNMDFFFTTSLVYNKS